MPKSGGNDAVPTTRNVAVRLPPEGRGNVMCTRDPTCAPAWSMVLVPSATSPVPVGSWPLTKEIRSRPSSDSPARVCVGTRSMVMGLSRPRVTSVTTDSWRSVDSTVEACSTVWKPLNQIWNFCP